MNKQHTGNALRGPDLHISFDSMYRGQTLVLANQNLVFRGGKTSCLLGPSGVGKSSLLRLIAGLLDKGDRAENLVVQDQNGQTIDHLVSMMDQREQLLPWASVGANVVIGDRLRGQRPDWAIARDLLQKTGLLDKIDTKPDALSGGMRQRVQLARCLYEKRPILLMDEPFSRLDAFTRMELQTLTARLTAGHTVILVTHDMDEAWKMGHDIYVQQVWNEQPKQLPMSDAPALPRPLADQASTRFRHMVMSLLAGHVPVEDAQ